MTDSAVYRLTIGDSIWKNLTPNFLDLHGSALALYNNTLFMSLTDGPVYEMELPALPVNIHTEISNKQKSYSFKSNQLTYTLSQKQFVSAEWISINGAHGEKIFAGWMEAGAHLLNINAKGHSNQWLQIKSSELNLLINPKL